MLNEAAIRETIGALMATRRPGHTLPQAFYRDPDIFEFDLRELHGRAWLMLGFEVEIPDPGSYMAVTIGRTPIIVLRGQDGALRGFFNSCRHRGAQIIPDGCGRTARLMCPYHQWIYDETGMLRGAGRMPRDFDRSAHGLIPIHVRTVAGTIYVCMAEEAPDFEDFHDHLAAMLEPHDLLNAKIAATATLIERGNWKLVMENARECYHCSARHPQLATSFPTDARANFESAGQADLARFVAEMEALGLRCGPAEGAWWQASRFALRTGNVSMSIDGGPCVKKPMCTVNGGDVGSLRWALEPHSFTHALGDFVFSFSAIPLAPEETLVVAKWLVHKDAQEGVDYDEAGLIQVWNETNYQDRELVETNQRGVNSIGYVPGPYSLSSESLALRFTDWYAGRVADLTARPVAARRPQLVAG